MRKMTEKAQTPLLLDGRALRDQKIPILKKKFAEFGRTATLVVVQIGSLAESTAYIAGKKKFGKLSGVEVRHIVLPETVSEKDVADTIAQCNQDKTVNGIILQLPIPAHLDKQGLIDGISPMKDVDGLTTQNKLRFEAGERTALVPATARGVLSLLSAYGVSVVQKKVVVIGRSALVGAPIATLLRREGADVTVCHRGTADIPRITRMADIIVIAIGSPRFLTKEFVSHGQVVVDVGINSVDGEKLEEEIPKKVLVGDVDFDTVKDIVSAISPVPGGVGPMTIVSLFENVLDAVALQK